MASSDVRLALYSWVNGFHATMSPDAMRHALTFHPASTWTICCLRPGAAAPELVGAVISGAVWRYALPQAFISHTRLSLSSTSMCCLPTAMASTCAGSGMRVGSSTNAPSLPQLSGYARIVPPFSLPHTQTPPATSRAAKLHPPACRSTTLAGAGGVAESVYRAAAPGSELRVWRHPRSRACVSNVSVTSMGASTQWRKWAWLRSVGCGTRRRMLSVEPIRPSWCEPQM